MSNETTGKKMMLAVFTALFLLGFSMSMVKVISVGSPAGNFSVSPGNVYFNWTMENLTITSNTNLSQYNIINEDNNINPSYYQKNRYSPSTYDLGDCFDSGLIFNIRNGTNIKTNYTTTMNETDTEWFNLTSPLSCPPGKYDGNFTVRMVSNHSENVSINTTVHIPINSKNTLSSRSAYFNTTIDSNATDYQSFYFNTSAVENSTAISFSLTGFKEDFDLFVFDSNNDLVTKSINKDSRDERIVFESIPSSPDMWEIRIFGNNTTSSEDLRGNFYFTVLNSTKSSLDFGSNNVSDNSTKTFTLKNEYNDVLNNVNEYSEIYRKDIWSNKNTSSDYKFLAPKFTKKIRVSLNWTRDSGENVTDWDLFLSDVNNNTLANSTDKYINANVTNATREEFIIYSGPFNNTNEGYWNISVRNQTNGPLNNYTVEAKVWLNESKWVETNYTDGFTFNRTNETVNSIYPVEANLTIPDNSMYGNYEGNLIYNNTEGWNYEIPFSFDVNSSVFTANDILGDFLESYETDNIGFNRIKTNQTLSFTLENTGNYNLSWINSTSGVMKKDNNSNITLNIEWPSLPIMPGNSVIMNVSAPINTTLTNNDPGIYKGWIFFNTTNQSNPSYPYNTLNMTLQMNLTNKLKVDISSIQSKDGDSTIENVSRNESVTYISKVKLINGTELDDNTTFSDSNALYINNFTNATIKNLNVTSEYHDLTSTIEQKIAGPQNLCDLSKNCKVNVTVPSSNLPGGYYRLSLDVEWNGSNTESKLSGSGIYKSLKINASGLDFTNMNYVGDFNSPGEIDFFNVTVTNYGLVDSGGISLNLVNCTGSDQISKSGVKTPTTIPANGTKSKDYSWKLTLDSNSNETVNNCYFEVQTSDRYFGTLPSDTFDIDTYSTANGGTNGGAGGQCTYTDWTNQSCGGGTCSATAMYQTRTNSSGTGCTYTERCIEALQKCGSKDISLSLENETVGIVQGGSGSNKLTANNTGDLNLTSLKLGLEGIEGDWYEIPSDAISLNTDEEKDITVNFSIPENASVDTYLLTYKISNDDVSASVNGNLDVLPSEETKVDINETFEEVKTNFTDLENRFNALKGYDTNLTGINETLSELRDKLESAKKHIENGNYLEAKKALDSAKSLYADAKKSLEEKEKKKPDYLLWIIAGVIVIILVAILVYLLLPPKQGYHPQKGFEYKPPKRENIFDKVKKELEDIIDKIKNKFGSNQNYKFKGK